MKKCQMHNKKRDKLSYTVTLHYSAVAGGFVYHFLVHLHDFRQRAVGWAMQIFFAADSACPRHHLLLQFGSQPSVHGAATWARQAAWQQVPIQQHIPCTCWSNPNVEAQRVPPAFTGEAERGSSHPSTRMMLLVLPHLSRPSEHALEEHKAPPARERAALWGTEHKIHHWHQPGHAIVVQVRGREPSKSPHTLLGATAASLVTTPVGVNCWGDSRASQMVRKLPNRRAWLPTNTPGCCCYILSNGLAGT